MEDQFLPHNQASKEARNGLMQRGEADHQGRRVHATFQAKKTVLETLVFTLPPKNTKNSDFSHKKGNCKRTTQKIKKPLPNYERITKTDVQAHCRDEMPQTVGGVANAVRKL